MNTKIANIEDIDELALAPAPVAAPAPSSVPKKAATVTALRPAKLDDDLRAHFDRLAAEAQAARDAAKAEEAETQRKADALKKAGFEAAVVQKLIADNREATLAREAAEHARIDAEQRKLTDEQAAREYRAAEAAFQARVVELDAHLETTVRTLFAAYANRRDVKGPTGHPVMGDAHMMSLARAIGKVRREQVRDLGEPEEMREAFRVSRWT